LSSPQRLWSRWVAGSWLGVIAAALPDTYLIVGSRARFEVLYRAHAGAVRSFARRRSSPTEADDVVAEVFLIAWRRLDDVPADPLPWLLGVARRVLANRRRGEARSLAMRSRLIGEGPTAESPNRTPAGGDSGVLQALGSLSERDQEVLVLVAWDGLAREDAAAVLGITAGTFAVRLYRARRRLLRALTAEDGRERAVERSSSMEVS
jgi:RNA polymerase sigma-70 factor, ECF subfamily